MALSFHYFLNIFRINGFYFIFVVIFFFHLFFAIVTSMCLINGPAI